ncbi:MAG: metallophosphoesterase [Vicinamibacterales bacterium]
MLAWSTAWWLLFGALMAPAVPGHWAGILLAATVLVLVPLLFLTRALSGAYPSAKVRLFAFRPFWYTQLAMPLMVTAGVAGFLAGAPFGAARASGQTAAAGMFAIVVAGVVAGYVGSRSLRVKRLEAAIADLPAGLDGLRIAQLSDTHVGPHTPARHLRAIVTAVQASKPDLIAITGDQVDDYPRDVEVFARAFGELRAPLGVFAIPGNHDVYAGWPEVRAGLEAMGCTVLVNDARPLVHRGERFWLVGTGDPAGIGRPMNAGGDAAPDIDRTLAPVPRGAFTVALAHNPALWPALAERGVALTLSGHTHYGQVAIPGLQWSLASAFLDLAMGAYRRGRSLLYINPGTNYWGLPLRLGALPEVTILTLRRAGEGAAGGIEEARG